MRRNGASSTAVNVHARFWVSSAVAGLRLGSAVDEEAAGGTTAAKPADARFPHTRAWRRSAGRIGEAAASAGNPATARQGSGIRFVASAEEACPPVLVRRPIAARSDGALNRGVRSLSRQTPGFHTRARRRSVGCIDEAAALADSDNRAPGPSGLYNIASSERRHLQAGLRVATPALATQTSGGVVSPGPKRWSFLSRVRELQARHGVAARRGGTRAAPRRGPVSRPARVRELEARHGVAEEARVVPIQAHERLQAAVGQPAVHLQHHRTRHFARAAVARAASRRPAASASRPSPHSWRPYRLPGTCTPMAIRAHSQERTCKE